MPDLKLEGKAEINLNNPIPVRNIIAFILILFIVLFGVITVVKYTHKSNITNNDNNTSIQQSNNNRRNNNFNRPKRFSNKNNNRN
jgi:hypothetical protein